MKESKRVVRAERYLDELKEMLAYAYDSEPRRKEVTEMFKKLEEVKSLLVELSVDQKVQNARLWEHFKKFKRYYEK